MSTPRVSALTDAIISDEIRQVGKRLRYAVLVEERGKKFLVALLASLHAAEKMALANVDDALPANTVAVFKQSVEGQWEFCGRAGVSGDGGTQYTKVGR